MAKEVVNIDIQIESKSVGELEEELSQINEELKQVKIGSQAFKDLSADSQKLTADLEKVNKEIEGFTLDKKNRNISSSCIRFSRRFRSYCRYLRTTWSRIRSIW